MFFQTRVKLEIVGLMPERALLKLRRAGITVYNVRKLQKDKLVLSVQKRDEEKVFAIYPKVCDTSTPYAPYRVRVLGTIGVGKYLNFAKNRVGFLLGALLFCILGLYADAYIFGVEFSASSVYAREAREALAKQGIKPFARYESGNEDLICSKLLALDGVEFCSVKKSGGRVIVEMRLGKLPPKPFEKGDMQAKHTGEILAITALQGTAQKQIGDTVWSGETLVGGWMENAEGERENIDVIAYARIACVYECTLLALDEKEAFATAYMQSQITDNDIVTEVDCQAVENGYAVRIAYVAVERINF